MSGQLDDLMAEYLDQKASNLTKRELFAAMAMQGDLSGQDGNEWFHSTDDGEERWVAKRAVAFADALLAELAKERPDG